jgi:hypothetical protein
VKKEYYSGQTSEKDIFMENEEIKVNVKRQDIWKRAVFMLVFVVAYSVAEFILGAIVLFQFLMVLITKETNEALKDFSAQLCKYIFQIVRYLSFNTEYQPFPFNQWPKNPNDRQSTGSSDGNSNEADRRDDAVIDENTYDSDPVEATNDIDTGDEAAANGDGNTTDAEVTDDSDDTEEPIVADKNAAETTDDAKNKPDIA